MLYKEYHDEDDKWSYTEWRYWCECTEPGDMLCFTIDDEEKVHMEICIGNRPNLSLWCRTKKAFKLLFGKEVVYVGIVLNENDRKELAAAIAGSEIVI